MKRILGRSAVPTVVAKGLGFGIATVLVLASAPARAQATDPSSLVSRIEIGVTGSFFDARTTGRIDASGGLLGTEIDFEDDLGLADSSTAPGAEIGFRLGRRHQISLVYSEVDRRGSRTLSSEIDFGNQTFPVGFSAESTFDLRRAGAIYTFWPSLHKGIGFGVSLGVIETEIDAALTGRLEVGPLEVMRTERASASAPLPLVGIELRGAPLDRLRIRGFGRLLTVNNVSGWSGNLRDLAVTAEVRILPHLWLGGGYSSYHLDVENEDEHIGRAVLDLDGFQAVTRITF